MNKEILLLKTEAEKYRYMYNIGLVNREEAKKHIMPYLEKVNAKQKELSKKYNQKIKTITFSSYCR